MGSSLRILPHYTYSDYLNWEGRWEIIEGIPYAMSPAPNPKHQWLVVNIVSELRQGIKLNGCNNCKVYDFIDYKPEEDIVVQPDALVVCGEIEKNYLDFSPALVVEILSPSTALKDRNSKYAIYESQKIPYYIIIDPDKETIELFCLNSEYTYQSADIGTEQAYTFEFAPGCTATVILNNIWQ